MLPKRRKPFGVSRNGLPIMEHPTQMAIDSGIKYRALVAGMVPEIEERDASVFANYNWTDWRNLDWFERAKAVAHHRTHKLVQLHNNDAVSAELERRSKVKR